MKKKYLAILSLIMIGVLLVFFSKSCSKNELEKEEKRVESEVEKKVSVEETYTEDEEVKAEETEQTEQNKVTGIPYVGETSTARRPKPSPGNSTNTKPQNKPATPPVDQPVTPPEEEKPSILDNAVDVDETGLIKYIPNEIIEKELMQDLYFYQEQLLSSTFVFDSNTKTRTQTLRLISLETGELLRQVSIPNVMNVNTQVLGDKIVISDATTGVIRVLNEKFEEISKYQVAAGQYAIMFLNTKMSKAYGIDWEENLCQIDLLNGTVTNLLPEAKSIYVSNTSGDCLTLAYVDTTTGNDEYAGVNLQTDILEKMQLKASFSGIDYNNDIWSGAINGTGGKGFLLGTQDKPYKYTLQNSGEFTELLNDPIRIRLMSFEDDGSQSMELYDTEGNYVSSCNLKDSDGSQYGEMYWSEKEKGYFFLVIDQAGFDKLFFWDLSVKTTGNDLELVPFNHEETSGSAVSQEYYDWAKSLSEQYGVTIKIADLCATDYSEQTVQPVLDEQIITRGLQVLEKAFESYPNNFFEQLYFGAYYKLEINLMGSISRKESIEGHNEIGFVSMDDGIITMVLNISFESELEEPEKTLEQLFYHETSHIIDAKLEHVARYNPDTGYSEEGWASYNPEGFPGYYGSYGILPEEYQNPDFYAYFVDDYSMTRATEDRARIMEHAMIGHSYYFKEFEEGVNGRRNKLAYYCESIRKSFDTTGWPEITKWEAGLIDNGEDSGGGKG